MSRRLPVYLLIDTSGSMKGEPIESVKVGLDAMISTLVNDPFALESVHLSIITFDREVKLLFPLTGIDDLTLPEISTPDYGPTHLGAALQLLEQRIDTEFIRNTTTQKGDWLPVLLVMTDGKPSDVLLYDEMCEKLSKRKFGRLIACAAGPQAKVEPLKKLTSEVYRLENLDSDSFIKLFQWVSASIDECNKSQGTGIDENANLPPPPEEIMVF
ncbi:vWA domain-containing protein [Succinimonas amylolytica]|uniref:vWA domain-containing protein n=1 Tax=Succinimonas amylolytica TaxID=83769 RepID=UPI000477FE2B|nr:VWA domain-containing protein [Succinimonas amylolytica]